MRRELLTNLITINSARRTTLEIMKGSTLEKSHSAVPVVTINSSRRTNLEIMKGSITTTYVWLTALIKWLRHSAPIFTVQLCIKGGNDQSFFGHFMVIWLITMTAVN